VDRRKQLDQTQAVSAAIEIQAFVRSRYCQKMLYEQIKNAVAATSIQSLVRSWACQRELRPIRAIMRLSEIAKLTSAAITVQSMLRSWKCQKELMPRREQLEQAQAVLATIKIQAFFRASQYRKVLSLRKCLALEKNRQDEWHRRVHASGKIQAVVQRSQCSLHQQPCWYSTVSFALVVQCVHSVLV
jgi:hypothetical protein